MSIWDGIDRDVFEDNLAALSKKAKFQNVARLPRRSIPQALINAESDVPALDAGLESQLADDFAFLASTTAWPRDVTAATVQLKTNPGRICVTIAANQGVGSPVSTAFEMILKSLERRARRGTIWKQPAGIIPS